MGALFWVSVPVLYQPSRPEGKKDIKKYAYGYA
jgi:hypothetical protein